MYSRLDINLSDRCNLSCGFCYAAAARSKESVAAPDEDAIKRQLDWFFNQAGKAQRLNVSIFGGEPLYEFPTLQRIVEYIRGEEQRRKIVVNIGIVTNLTLLTEERLDWLETNRIGIHCSIDGCAEAQDMFRKFADGSGTSALVYENAKRLLSRRKGATARMTITPETLPYLAKSCKFLYGLGFRSLNSVIAGGVEWKDEHRPIFTEQIRLLTDWYLELQKQRKPLVNLFHIRNIKNVLDRKAKGLPRQSVCRAGVNRIAIDTKGNLSPCHRFANPSTPESWLFGTVESGVTNTTLKDALASATSETLKREADCAACTVKEYCYATCWHEAMQCGAKIENGEISVKPDPFWCFAWQTYLSEAQRTIKQRVDLRGCAPCKAKLLAAMKQRAQGDL